MNSAFALIFAAISLQTCSLGPCDRDNTTLKTRVPSPLKACIISAFSTLFDTCVPCDVSIICQKRSGIACLRIYNLDLFLNRKILGDPIRLELKRKTLNRCIILIERCKVIFKSRGYLSGKHLAQISARNYVVIAYTGDRSFTQKRN